MAGLLEPAGVAVTGPINAVGYLLWSGWLIATGIAILLAQRPQRRRNPIDAVTLAA